MDDALRERLWRLETRVAVEERIARYCFAIDLRDRAALLDCFTEDVEFRRSDGSFDRGRDRLWDYFVAALGDMGPTWHLPFNNLVVTQTLTGAQLKNVLEQQFVGFGGQTTQRILQVSAGLTYTWSASAAPGAKVGDLSLNGTPIDPAANYLVTTNDFLANGGDGFSNLTLGTGRVTAPGFDVDALVAYLAGGPIAPGPANRIATVA